MFAGAGGKVTLSLAPLQCIVWQALDPLPPPGRPASISFASPAGGSTLVFAERGVYGHVIAVRQELLANVEGGDGFAEVTFTMRRGSRPGQSELLGTSDAPPYRVFWRPPADLASGDELTFIATLDDLRGHRASATVAGVRVAPTSISFGIKGATVPVFTREPDADVRAAEGQNVTLTVSAAGTEPLDYTWLHDGSEIGGAKLPELRLGPVSANASGHYLALVRNREGTSISRDILVRVDANTLTHQ
jgi:hypothetical protein